VPIFSAVSDKAFRTRFEAIPPYSTSMISNFLVRSRRFTALVGGPLIATASTVGGQTGDSIAGPLAQVAVSAPIPARATPSAAHALRRATYSRSDPSVRPRATDTENRTSADASPGGKLL
jgi:hypothetical protein